MRMKAQTYIQGRSTRNVSRIWTQFQALPLSLLFTSITASRILLESLRFQEYSWQIHGRSDLLVSLLALVPISSKARALIANVKGAA